MILLLYQLRSLSGVQGAKWAGLKSPRQLPTHSEHLGGDGWKSRLFKKRSLASFKISVETYSQMSSVLLSHSPFSSCASYKPTREV